MEIVAYPHNDISPGFPFADFDVCIEFCKNTDRCVTITFSETSDCFLKFAISEAERRNVMSGRNCALVEECDGN